MTLTHAILFVIAVISSIGVGLHMASRTVDEKEFDSVGLAACLIAAALSTYLLLEF